MAREKYTHTTKHLKSEYLQNVAVFMQAQHLLDDSSFGLVLQPLPEFYMSKIMGRNSSISYVEWHGTDYWLKYRCHSDSKIARVKLHLFYDKITQLIVEYKDNRIVHFYPDKEM